MNKRNREAKREIEALYPDAPGPDPVTEKIGDVIWAAMKLGLVLVIIVLFLGVGGSCDVGDPGRTGDVPNVDTIPSG